MQVCTLFCKTSRLQPLKKSRACHLETGIQKITVDINKHLEGFWACVPCSAVFQAVLHRFIQKERGQVRDTKMQQQIDDLKGQGLKSWECPRLRSI